MPQHIDLITVLDQVAPIIAQNSTWLDATDGFIGENFDLLKEHGVFSALVPTEYGGGGATHTEMAEFIRELAHACPSTALTLSMHSHLVSAAVANDRAGRPGRALLEKVSSGQVILVSTGANDWLASNGSAVKVEGGYQVTAFKPFASGSPKGDMMVTSVSYDDPIDGPLVLHFPLPMSTDGVSLLGDWQTLGMRATGSQTVKIDGAFVPEAAIALKRPRNGFHPAFSVILTVAMPLIMSAYTGAAEKIAEMALERSHTKSELNYVLAGELINLLETARMARKGMIDLCNDFEFTPSEQLASDVLVHKTVCADHVTKVASKAMEVAGGLSFMRKNGIERFFRDLQGARFHPLPEKRQQLFTGRVALGLEPVETAQPVLQAAE
ncbi:acyl-CoA/acyl-ACP dehydrogenase [Aliiroseovarius sp. KMU-50]|uniref:Acyl-CoA/acyl-ACP dehydrogenase n=1 Tax=Aliiroseovarius salicola TaxID=3009082 RepID=A0ABT4VZQ1_9RHOB|nr:acyl-CoA dehydrogenase family protein [Aliiroseovarius sp. KMU-50]MDA5093733.1 acyl-CoA/acyl-ACP dehydrogenase [Aliiroseovarius sp. KMU-50]